MDEMKEIEGLRKHVNPTEVTRVTEEESSPKKPIMPSKYVWIALGILLVLILVVGMLFVKETEEKSSQTKEEQEEAFKAKTGYDSRLRETIQNDNYVNNKGKIFEGYKYNDQYYLTLNQSGVFEYNKSYPGDILLWVKEKGGKVSTKQLNDGDKLLSVVEMNGSPYLTQDGHTYIIFYEKEGNEQVGYVADGYVYEIKKDGSIKKQYETAGHFHALAKDSEGKLVLLEKVFIDSRNSFPLELKPYKVKRYVLDKNKWTLTGEETVDPTKDKTKK
ncbi:hypothetical protein CN918_26960 [Priestia megaterium]|nr:hypothetical protein CN918_26960 [Priestia megaterium]